jgi:uncharacterized damage-inducible protein DinB
MKIATICLRRSSPVRIGQGGTSMYSVNALLDMHERGQRSLQKLLLHCGQLDAEELDRELPGFGYPNVRQQLEHMIDAQEYWISVVQGRFTGEFSSTEYPTIEALEAYRKQVAEVTGAYLRLATEAELNTAREMLTWPDKMRALVPAQVFLRTLTHIYQHQGQVLAMCRLLGRPGPVGLDFPLD